MFHCALGHTHDAAPRRGQTQAAYSGFGWLNELLPYTGRIADEICLLRAMHTEASRRLRGRVDDESGRDREECLRRRRGSFDTGAHGLAAPVHGELPILAECEGF